MKKRVISIVMLVIASLVMVCLTVQSYYALRLLECDQVQLQVGLETLAQRIREHADRDRVMREMDRASAVAKVRAFANIVEKDPQSLGRPGVLEKIAADLGVTDLSVSDEKGILVHTLPASSRGYDMASHAQSAAFLPALTNTSFVLYQEPMLRGSDSHEMFQYVGVARRDRPGIVQIGFRMEDHDVAQTRTQIEAFARSTHIGNGWKVKVYPKKGLPPPVKGFVSVVENGWPFTKVEIDCDDWRIGAYHSTMKSPSAAEACFRLLVLADFALLLMVIFTIASLTRSVQQDVRALRTLFSGRFSKRASFSRVITNPVTLACAMAFLLAIGVTWLTTAHTAQRSARARLLAASADMRKMVNECADNLLFYQGLSIVRHYRSPENMTLDDIAKLKDRYALDELTVVNRKGIVLAGTLAVIGFDTYTNPNVAKFNCLLNGVQTYSQDFRPAVENPSGDKFKYAGVAFPPPAKGYIQLGFSEKRLRNGINFWFEDAANNLHIGERGYFIIADNETGEIKSCGHRDAGQQEEKRSHSLAEIGFVSATAPTNRDEFFENTLFGERCLCLSDVNCYHRIICAVPMDEISGGGRRTVLTSVLALFAVFLLVIFFMSKLTDLVSSLQEKERIERERQFKDLTLAKTIQVSALAHVFPDENDYKIFARMDTAREVGGDFYDFYELPTGEIIFLIADVSGKGIPAALFMMRAKETLRSAIFARADDLSAAVAAANDTLAEMNDAEMFVTAWIGVYNRKTGLVTYINAGHNPPLVKHSDGSVEWLRGRSGLVLAAMAGLTYRTYTVTLSPGDSIFLYTDGVTEAMDVSGRQYGEERLETVLRTNTDGLFVTRIREDVTAFVGAAEPSDDITMLALDLKPAARS